MAIINKSEYDITFNPNKGFPPNERTTRLLEEFVSIIRSELESLREHSTEGNINYRLSLIKEYGRVVCELDSGYRQDCIAEKEKESNRVFSFTNPNNGSYNEK